MELRKATRQKAKIKLGLSAVSGGGKTYSAILIAKGLTGDLSKVAIIDTENNSADLYAHLGDYNVLPLQAPYTPERYIQAITACEAAGMECIIIDSITHEWNGKGGILDIHGSMTGNSFTNWAQVTPRHQKFIDKILQCSCHVITTVRRKQDYDMVKDGNKTVVNKAGLKEETREGFEYELTANLELDIKHNANALKDRTGLFMGNPPFTPSEETGVMIREWCDTGVDMAALNKEELENALENLKNCTSVEDLTFLKQGLSTYVINNEVFKAAGFIRFNELKPKPETQNN